VERSVAPRRPDGRSQHSSSPGTPTVDDRIVAVDIGGHNAERERRREPDILGFGHRPSRMAPSFFRESRPSPFRLCPD